MSAEWPRHSLYPASLMDDVVALEVRLAGEVKPHFFLTWGRLHDRVNPAPLEAVVRGLVERRTAVDNVRVCDSLREAAGARFFHEALLHFAWRPVPFGDGYTEWAARTRAALEAGHELYDCGTW
jgi:hypothetical protein